MRLLCISILAAGIAFGASDGQSTPRQAHFSPYDVFLPHVVEGGPWTTTITLVNLGTAEASFNLWFHGSTGEPRREFTFEGIGKAYVVSGKIAVGGSMTIATVGGPDVSEGQGWADLETESEIGGMAVFRQVVAGRPDFEAVVPFGYRYDHRWVFPFDNTGPFTTCFALVNPDQSVLPSSAVVNVSIRDEQGSNLLQTTLTVGPGEHKAFAAPAEWEVTAGKRGVIELTTGSFALSAIGLRFHDSGAFTSFNGFSLW